MRFLLAKSLIALGVALLPNGPFQLLRQVLDDWLDNVDTTETHRATCLRVNDQLRAIGINVPDNPD